MTAADKIPQHRKKIAGKATNMQMANCPVPRTLETGQGTNPCIRHDEYPTTSKAIAMSQNSRRTPSHCFISRPFSLTNRRSAAGKVRCPSTGPYSSAASSRPSRAAASASPSVFWFSQVPQVFPLLPRSIPNLPRNLPRKPPLKLSLRFLLRQAYTVKTYTEVSDHFTQCIFYRRVKPFLTKVQAIT